MFLCRLADLLDIGLGQHLQILLGQVQALRAHAYLPAETLRLLHTAPAFPNLLADT